jgi:hypothetical protein
LNILSIYCSLPRLFGLVALVWNIEVGEASQARSLRQKLIQHLQQPCELRTQLSYFTKDEYESWHNDSGKNHPTLTLQRDANASEGCWCFRKVLKQKDEEAIYTWATPPVCQYCCGILLCLVISRVTAAVRNLSLHMVFGFTLSWDLKSFSLAWARVQRCLAVESLFLNTGSALFLDLAQALTICASRFRLQLIAVTKWCQSTWALWPRLVRSLERPT